MRGMKKWLPFKSLNGQYEYIEAMKKEKKKVEKPELSLDQIDELNHALITFRKGDIAKVKYFQDGEIIQKEAVFLRCNGVSKTVDFKGFTLTFKSLIALE